MYAFQGIDRNPGFLVKPGMTNGIVSPECVNKMRVQARNDKWIVSPECVNRMPDFIPKIEKATGIHMSLNKNFNMGRKTIIPGEG